MAVTKNRIFISYRRGDSNATANWIFEKLKDTFGANDVFLDTSDNEVGIEWDKSILGSLEEAQVVLVVIGKAWLTVGMDEFGQRRIDKEDDWVRKEIELAFKKNKRIYPLLLDDAKIPPAAALPDSIKKLANLQFDQLKVNSASHDGMEKVIATLKEWLEKIDAPDDLKEVLEKVIAKKYELVKQIGIGSTFKVYLAKDTALDRDVTVRAVQDQSRTQDFIDTIRNAAKIVEIVPNCTPILGAWIDRHPAHVVMGYLESGTLRELVDEKEGRPLSLTAVQNILLELGEALCIAHKAGITHCNIKPSNVFLSVNNKPFISPLCRLQKTNKTYFLQKVGTRMPDCDGALYREGISYLPPEVFDRDYIEKSQIDRNEKIDQYMLGLLGYEMLVGKIPETINDLKPDLTATDFQKLPPVNTIRKDCPNNLSVIIQKMTALRPGERFDSVSEAVSEIKKVSFDDVEIAKESFTRCMSDKNTGPTFFKTFYHEFLRLCPEALTKFEDSPMIGKENFHKQYDKLREAIFILLIFAEKKMGKEEPNVLTRIAQRHSKGDYDIPAPFYDRFLEALVNTVCGTPLTIPEACDEQCRKSENEKERIAKAWRKAMEPGIEYMKKRYWTVVE